MIEVLDDEYKTISVSIINPEGIEWRRAFCPGDIDGVKSVLSEEEFKYVTELWTPTVLNKYNNFIQNQNQIAEQERQLAVISNAEKAAHKENELRNLIIQLIEQRIRR